MKRTTTIFTLLGAVTVVLFLSSCGSLKQNDFTRAKYYNFGHHDQDVSLNKPTTTNRQQIEPNKVAHEGVIKVNTNTPVVTYNTPGIQTQKEALTVSKKLQKNQKHNILVASPATTTIALENKTDVIFATIPDGVQSNKNVEKSGGTVPLVVQIILALIIPPLAVLLHDDFRLKLHFWLILLFWLAAIYGILGPLGLILEWLWLAAVIWALIVVLSSAQSV
jgi:hypothetical protein